MKKLLLSLVALLTTVGAWAQLADGVYTIKNVINNRGTLVAVEGQTNVGAADITLSGYESKSETAMTHGDKWYVSTVEGYVFLYNVANGKFLNSKQADPVQFTDNPVVGFSLTANGDYYVISNGSFKVSCCPGYNKGQTVRWLSDDEAASQHLTFTFVENGTTTFAAQVEVADEAIALATSAKTNLQKLIDLAKTYESGTNIGDYTENAIKGLKEAIDAAQAKIAADNVTDADVEALQAVIDALEIVLPDAEKFYVLRCNYENRYIYVNSANKLQWTGEAHGNASNYVWKFVAGSARNTVKMMSVHTQSYLNTVSNNQQAAFGEGVDVTIKKASGVDGACVFEAGNAGIGLHAHGANNTVIGYTNSAGANPYFFEEVEEFSHTLSVGENGWASLVLGFNATIPANVEVYTVSEATKTKAELELVAEVVPANEAVLVKAGEGNYAFDYTKAEGNVTSNLLEGTLFNKSVNEGAYVLAEVNGNVGLYSATLTDGTFQNKANKAYLPATAVPAGARFLSFDFGTETAIESIEGENGNVKAEIYDLAGRRVQKAQKGLYIVNGVKVIK